MKKKRKILIDKNFQLKLAASLTLPLAAIVAVFILIITYSYINNMQKLKTVEANIRELASNQDEIYKTLLSFSEMKNLMNVRISTLQIKRDMEANNAMIAKNNSVILEINRSNQNIIAILIILSLIQSIILFYIIIKRSHRISGPVFLLNRYFDEIINGKFPEVKPLRKNDDFKKLFEKFKELVDYLKIKKKRQTKKPVQNVHAEKNK